jgi:hypothetical protein
MTIEHNEKVEQLPTSNVLTSDEDASAKHKQGLKHGLEENLENMTQKNSYSSISDSTINQNQKATVKITANYAFKKNSKGGGGKLLIDRDSVAGELVISSASQASDEDTVIPLTIEKFKVSDNFKKVSYKATTSKNERAISGKVSGVLRLQDTAVLTTANYTEQQQAFSNLQWKKGKIKVKLGRSLYHNAKNSSASIILTEA